MSVARTRRGCDTCRKRKVRCDLGVNVVGSQSCNRCLSAGWSCPGVPPEGVTFRHTTIKHLKHKYQSQQGHPQFTKRQELTRRCEAVEAEPVQHDESDTSTSSGPVQLFKPWRQAQIQIPRYLAMPVESHGVSLFFTENLDCPVRGNVQGPFTIVLARTYARVDDKSPLARLVTTLGLNELNQRHGSAELKMRAQKSYADAVRSMRTALVNPCKKDNDDLLHAIVLLSFVEASINGKPTPVDSVSNHWRGAVALLYARGGHNFKEETLQMYYPEIYAMNALESIEKATSEPMRGLLLPHEYLTKASGHHQDSLLRIICVIPDLRCRAKRSLIPGTNEAAVKKLLAESLHCDVQLKQWEEIARDSFVPIHTLSSDVVLERNLLPRRRVWPGPIKIYADAHSTNTRSYYLVARIYLLGVVMQCYRWLLAQSPTSLEPAVEVVDGLFTATKLIGALVDEICADAPFRMGFRPFKAAEGIYTSGETLRCMYCAFLLIRPLHCASQVQCISQKQRGWLKDQLVNIADWTGLELARHSALSQAFDVESRVEPRVSEIG